MKKICRKLMTLLLSISIFFSTGVLNVFADETINYSSTQLQTKYNEVVTELGVVKTKISGFSRLLEATTSQQTEYNRLNALVTTVDTDVTANKITYGLPTEVIEMSNVATYDQTTINSGMTKLVDYSTNISSMSNYINYLNTYLMLLDSKNEINTYITNSALTIENRNILNQGDIITILDNLLNTLTVDNILEINTRYNEVYNIFYSNNPTIEYLNTFYSKIVSNITNLDSSMGNVSNNHKDILNSIDVLKFDINKINTVNDIKNIMTNNVFTDEQIQAFIDYMNELNLLNKNINKFNELKTIYDLRTAVKPIEYTTYTSYVSSLNTLITTGIYTNFTTSYNTIISNSISSIQTSYSTADLIYSTEVDRLTKLNIINNFKIQLDRVNQLSSLMFIDTNTWVNLTNDVNNKFNTISLSMDNSLSSLMINSQLLDVTKDNQEITIDYSVNEINVSAVKNNSFATVAIIKPNELVVGKNIVKIIVTAQNGSVRTYTIDVIKAEEVISPIVESKTVAYTPTKTSTDTTKEETPITNTVDKDYNEEVLEESDLSGWTILLVVGGIGLISFGIYLLFGDKKTPIIIKKKTVVIGKQQQTNKNKTGKIAPKTQKIIKK